MNYKITLKCKEEFRSFPKDYEVTFDYNNTNVIFLMGVNGCGKSTLVQAIRGSHNSNKDAKAKWGACDTTKLISDMFDITNECFDKFYHIDLDGLDNPFSMYNASDATSFIEFGGWSMRNMSMGEKATYMLGKYKEEIEDGDNTLLIIDELDNHLDFVFKQRFVAFLNKLFPKSKKLIITHDIIIATLNDGDIYEMFGTRTKENHMQCKLSTLPPFIYRGDYKYNFFKDVTHHTLSKD